MNFSSMNLLCKKALLSPSNFRVYKELILGSTCLELLFKFYFRLALQHHLDLQARECTHSTSLFASKRTEEDVNSSRCITDMWMCLTIKSTGCTSFAFLNAGFSPVGSLKSSIGACASFFSSSSSSLMYNGSTLFLNYRIPVNFRQTWHF